MAKYASSKIPQLKLADKDARQFADFISTQTKLFRIICATWLINEDTDFMAGMLLLDSKGFIGQDDHMMDQGPDI